MLLISVTLSLYEKNIPKATSNRKQLVKHYKTAI